ncbi:hypothetical protein ACFZAC_15505 [Pseudomonas fluorescens]|uniref:hypothetical protein n=1 Tax=Pseudomonas fluorescens TaxID=294 RepID=UPI00374986DE
MIVKSPFENVALSWEPKVSYFLGALEIYDREEEGELYLQYDPNVPGERKEVIEKFLIPSLNYLGYRHKYALLELLKNALADQSYDFSALFESDYDECITMVWSEGEVEDARLFFEDIYRVASEVWEQDLHHASLEDQLSW